MRPHTTAVSVSLALTSSTRRTDAGTATGLWFLSSHRICSLMHFQVKASKFAIAKKVQIEWRLRHLATQRSVRSLDLRRFQVSVLDQLCGHLPVRDPGRWEWSAGLVSSGLCMLPVCRTPDDTSHQPKAKTARTATCVGKGHHGRRSKHSEASVPQAKPRKFLFDQMKRFKFAGSPSIWTDGTSAYKLLNAATATIFRSFQGTQWQRIWEPILCEARGERQISKTQTK